MTTLIDLSGEFYSKMPRLPHQPSVLITPYNTHNEIRVDDGYAFSVAVMSMTLPDHCGTHVDAPAHFDARPGAATIDEMPLERFYTEAVCLDLSHIPMKSDISIADLAAAEAEAGVEIKPGDTVLLHMDLHRRVGAGPALLTDFPGLTKASAIWLGDRGIGMFGVEAVSPGRPGRNNFEVHHVCRDMGFTHIEGLANLDRVVGKGRFRFIGFPLRIRGGFGSPIRAVALLEDN
jgi:kynurenine formamidase